jgi:hypothetical protein
MFSTRKMNSPMFSLPVKAILINLHFAARVSRFVYLLRESYLITRLNKSATDTTLLPHANNDLDSQLLCEAGHS